MDCFPNYLTNFLPWFDRVSERFLGSTWFLFQYRTHTASSYEFKRSLYVQCVHRHNTTKRFKNLELQNPLRNFPEQLKISRSPDIKAPKLWKSWSGNSLQVRKLFDDDANTTCLNNVAKKEEEQSMQLMFVVQKKKSGTKKQPDLFLSQYNVGTK